jgi:hypothetical protein
MPCERRGTASPTVKKPLMAVKPRDGGRAEKVSLDRAATHIVEVLFGFQLIAVFSEGFAEKLSAAVRFAMDRAAAVRARA